MADYIEQVILKGSVEFDTADAEAKKKQLETPIKVTLTADDSKFFSSVQGDLRKIQQSVSKMDFSGLSKALSSSIKAGVASGEKEVTQFAKTIDESFHFENAKKSVASLLQEFKKSPMSSDDKNAFKDDFPKRVKEFEKITNIEGLQSWGKDFSQYFKVFPSITGSLKSFNREFSGIIDTYNNAVKGDSATSSIESTVKELSTLEKEMTNISTINKDGGLSLKVDGIDTLIEQLTSANNAVTQMQTTLSLDVGSGLSAQFETINASLTSLVQNMGQMRNALEVINASLVLPTNVKELQINNTAQNVSSLTKRIKQENVNLAEAYKDRTHIVSSNAEDMLKELNAPHGAKVFGYRKDSMLEFIRKANKDIEKPQDKTQLDNAQLSRIKSATNLLSEYFGLGGKVSDLNISGLTDTSKLVQNAQSQVTSHLAVVDSLVQEKSHQEKLLELQKASLEASKQQAAQNNTPPDHASPKKKAKNKNAISEEEFMQSEALARKNAQSIFSSKNMESVNLTTKQLASGVAKVSADVKDADGKWQQFNATISKSGELVNSSFKDSRKNVNKLDDQLADQQKSTTKLTMEQMSNEALKVRNTLGLKDEQKWSVSVDQSGFVTIKNLLNDITSSAAKSEQTFRNSTEAISHFNGIAQKSKVTLSEKPAEKKQSSVEKTSSPTNTTSQIKSGYTSEISKTELELKNLGIYSQEAKSSIASLKQQLNGLDATGLESFGKGLNETLSSIKTDSIQKNISEIDAAFSKLTAPNDDKIASYKTQFQQLQSYISEYKKSLQSGKLSDVLSSEGLKSLDDAHKKIQTMMKDMSNDKYNSSNGKGMKLYDVDNLKDAQSKLKSISDEWKAQNAKVTENFDKGFISANLQQADGSIQKVRASIDAVKTSAGDMSYVIRENVAATSSVGNNLSAYAGRWKGLLSSASQYFTQFMSMYRVVGMVREGFNDLKAYNDALTTISYTMDMSSDSLDNLGKSSIGMAKDLSTTIDDAMQITQVYANMQTTAQEIMTTAKPTIMLSNSSGVSADTAADQIQGVLQQFEMTEDDSEHIVDVYEKISANLKLDYAAGIEAMSAGVKATGQMAKAAGLSYEQLASIVGTTAETTRESGESIGNSIKTILTRISKASTMDETIDPETISNASKALHSVGVEVYTTSGEFREFDTIMAELADKWDGLTESQQANISFQVAATRQTNKFKSILQNWDKSMALADDAANNSAGTALATQEKFEESYTGSLNRLKTASSEFWITFLNGDQTKGAIDGVTTLVSGFTKLADTIGSVNMIGAGAGLFASLKNVGGNKKLFLKDAHCDLVVTRNEFMPALAA